MPPEEQANSLDRLQQRLYETNGAARPVPDIVSAQQAPQIQSEHWNEPVPMPRPRPPKKGLSWTVWFAIGSLVFFVIAIGATALYLFLGGRSVSNDNTNVTIQGPTTIASGTTVPIVINVQNHNPTDITNASISIPFPDGTRSPDDVTQPLVRYTGEVGTVPTGGTVTRTVQAVLFGTVNQSVTVPVTITYGAANSNATFTKTVNYTFTITSSPLTITAQSVGSVSSGQTFTIALAVRSNATTALQNVAVAAQLPSSFTSSASSATSTGGAVYTIGTLQPGQEKDITLSGSLSGADNDQQDFQFMVGTVSDTDSQQLGVAYASADTKVSLTQPFLATTLSLNNASTDPTVVSGGQTVSGTLSWQNTLSSPITNAQIIVSLAGSGFDPTTVQVANGFYSSSNNTLTFNGQTEDSLLNLNPGDTGTGSFSFTMKPAANLQGSAPLTLSVSVSGRVNGSLQTIQNTVTKQVQLATSLGLSSSILHASGPFGNTGPVPPIANATTTYTVQLAITNTVNPVAGAVVTAILPPYVTFTGNVSPTDGSLTYDDPTRTVTWKAGSIAAGSAAPTTADFQIAFLPSVSQAGQSPVLVESQELTATDRVTQGSIDTTANALTTQTPSDPGYKASFGNVSN